MINSREIRVVAFHRLRASLRCLWTLRGKLYVRRFIFLIKWKRTNLKFKLACSFLTKIENKMNVAVERNTRAFNSPRNTETNERRRWQGVTHSAAETALRLEVDRKLGRLEKDVGDVVEEENQQTDVRVPGWP